MNIQQAKQIKLFDLLAHLGYHPNHSRNGGNDVWYFSPFRQEDTPSFHINLKHNCWFDFAESGKGDHNSIVDFVIKYKKTDVRGALNFLESLHLVKSSSVMDDPLPPSLFSAEERKVEVISIKPLFSFPLKNYLKDERGIDLDLGMKYLKEVKYCLLEGENQGKEFYSLGFRNRSGGWALRNKHFKTATKPNDISVIETESEKVSVYEGFINFLSHLMLSSRMSPATDVIILNSNSLKEIGKDFIKQKGYNQVYCFLDNDEAGRKTFQYFQKELPLVTNCSRVYGDYNDLNEYLIRRSKSQ
jgi:hypothetical protein